jgi:hypothetical protein
LLYDADPDPNFHVDADPDPDPDRDPDPDWHEMMPVLVRILPQVSHVLENQIFLKIFSQTFCLFLNVLGRILKFVGKNIVQLFHMRRINR